MILEMTAFFRTSFAPDDGGEMVTAKSIFLNEDQTGSVLQAARPIPELHDLTKGLEHLMRGVTDDMVVIVKKGAESWQRWAKENPALHRKLSFESLPLWMVLCTCRDKQQQIDFVQMTRIED